VARLRTALFSDPAQVLDLLDQMLKVERIEPSSTQQGRLVVRPGVQVVFVWILSGRLDPCGHDDLLRGAASLTIPPLS
jgi:hypothetical protein